MQYDLMDGNERVSNSSLYRIGLTLDKHCILELKGIICYNSKNKKKNVWEMSYLSDNLYVCELEAFKC